MRKRLSILLGLLFFTLNLSATINYTPSQPNVEQQVTFTVTHPNGIFQVLWWNFGDETQSSGDNRTIVHIYRKTGAFTVQVAYYFIGQPLGGTPTIEQITITILEKRKITYTPLTPPANQPVTLKAENFLTTNIKWDFGDGTSPFCSSPTQTHTYTKEGTYTVKAWDWCGDSIATISTIITIGKDPRKITFTPSNPSVNQPITFRAENFFYPTCIGWDFGDGTPTVFSTTPETHVYKKSGTFTVRAWDGCDIYSTPLSTTTTVAEGAGPLAPFQISFIQLRFEDGKSYKVVPKEFKPFVAYADVKYEGTGIFEAQWLVDGAPFKYVSQPLPYAQSTAINSGEIPSLPTQIPGTHYVSIKILNPPTEFTMPVISYFVESKAVEIKVPEVLKIPKLLILSGKVIDSISKKPVANAIVEYWEVNPKDRSRAQTGLASTTDSQGNFKFIGIPSNSWFELEASSKYHLSVKLISANLTPEDITLELIPISREITGIIESYVPGTGGKQSKWEPDLNVYLKPVEGIISGVGVALTYKFGERTIPTRTDSSGRFSFKDVPAGEYGLFVDDWRFEEGVIKVFECPLDWNLGTIEISPLVGTLKVKVVYLNRKNTNLSGEETISIFPTDVSFDPEEDPGKKAPPLINKKIDKEKAECVFTEIPITKPGSFSFYKIYFSGSDYYEDGWGFPGFVYADKESATTVYVSKRVPKIMGYVNDSITLEAIRGAKVELVYEIGNQEKKIKEAKTNGNGFYTIKDFEKLDPNLQPFIRCIKDGYEKFTYSFSPQSDLNSLQAGKKELSKNINLKPITLPPLKGRVLDEGGTVIVGVEVSASPGDKAYTDGNGEFSLDNIRRPEITLTFSKENFDVLSLDLLFDSQTWIIKDNGKPFDTVVLKSPKGNLKVTVKDEDKGLIANASVQLLKDGKIYKELATDIKGEAFFENISIGNWKLNIGGPFDSDYVSQTTEVTIKREKTTSLEISLTLGGRITGTVVDEDGNPVPSADVEIKNTGIRTNTGTGKPAGSFILRGIPERKHSLVAIKYGYFPANLAIDIQKGKTIGLEKPLILKKSPITELFGFKVVITSLVSNNNGTKNIGGYIYGVPSSSIIEVGKDVELLFGNLIVGSDNRPISDSIKLSTEKIPIKIYGFNAELVASSGNLEVKSNKGIGEIIGEVVLDNSKNFSGIPGAQWVKEKLKSLIPIRSDGSSEQNEWGITTAGNTARLVELWGFVLEIDYTSSKFDKDGFHYYGSISIPGFEKFKFEDLTINSNLNVKPGKISISNPITLDLKAFKIVIESATWDASGLTTNGRFEITALGKATLKFKDMKISSKGDLLGCKGAQGSFYLYKREFKVKEFEFRTDSKKKRYFLFSGELKLEYFDNPILFDKLRLEEDGDFTGIISSNQTYKFAGIVKVELKSLEFYGDYMLLKGGIDFKIPSLEVVAGDFKYYKDGKFTLEKFEIGFNAVVAKVKTAVSWNNNKFSGEGEIDVTAFKAGVKFSYKDESNWSFQFEEGIPIVIGAPPFTITLTDVRGGLEKKKIWIVTLGGTFTYLPATQYVASLDLDLTVKTGGPIIKGTAEIMLFKELSLAKANVTLDFKIPRFTGNVSKVFNQYGINFSQTIGFEINLKDDAYYLGGEIKAEFLSILDASGGVYFAYNYHKPHDFPVPLHGNINKINGVHIDAKVVKKIDLDLEIVGLEGKYSVYAFANIDPFNNIYAGGGSIHASVKVYVDFGFVEPSVEFSFDAHGVLAYSSGWACDFKGEVQIKLGLSDDCDDYWTICPTIGVHVKYSQGHWDVDFSAW